MPVALVGRKSGSIDIVCPDGDKGVDVARESRHEARQNSGYSEAQQAMAIVTHHQRRQGLIIVEPKFGTEQNGCREAGKYDQNREKEFRGCSYQRSADDSSGATCGEGPLDEYKIGAPISKTQDKTKSHGDAEDIQAGRAWTRDWKPYPGMTHGRLEVGGDPGDAVEIVQDEEYERRQAENNKCELDHFVVHRGGEAAQGDVDEDYGGCGERGFCEVAAEKGTQYLRQCVEANARNENHHDAATDNIQGSRSLVEPQFKEFRYGQGTAPDVDRHHAEGEEEHGGV